VTAETPAGEWIGAGRSADVYAIGQGRVLRRYRAPIDVQAEAEIMTYLHRAGYPVPQVHDAAGRDLVMDRLDGRDMLADFGRRPWLIRRHARTLADLHNRLHQIPAPAGLARFGISSAAGDRVLHLDLHPANVMLTANGPVVIDWVNARAGPAGADVAMAYLIMATSDIDLVPAYLRPIVAQLRAVLFRDFLAAVTDDMRPFIAEVARARMADRNTRPSELARLSRIAEQAEQERAG
jgi:aminoglycoside phosphotransferase (APT) family kinase protein